MGYETAKPGEERTQEIFYPPFLPILPFVLRQLDPESGPRTKPPTHEKRVEDLKNVAEGIEQVWPFVQRVVELTMKVYKSPIVPKGNWAAKDMDRLTPEVVLGVYCHLDSFEVMADMRTLFHKFRDRFEHTEPNSQSSEGAYDCAVGVAVKFTQALQTVLGGGQMLRIYALALRMKAAEEEEEQREPEQMPPPDKPA